MKFKTPILTGACCAALLLAAALPANAKPKKPAMASPTASPAMSAAAEPATAPKMRAIPFHGMISSVDESAKTFTIAGKEKSRTFKITDKTVITKAGAAATMKEVTANEQARGSYYKMEDGTMEAKSIKLGPLTAEEQAKKDARKAKRAAKKAGAAEAEPSASPKK